MQQKPNIDYKKLTPEQRDQLENYELKQKQLQTLQDIADISQETLSVLDSQKQESSDSSKQVGALLVDMREAMNALKDREDPEQPDFAKPIVEAITKASKAHEAAIKAIDIKPVIDAPQVNVAPPSVDLKGVEKAVSQIPKAFADAVSKIDIPKPEQTDFQPLLDAWEGISDQLLSIENATRMKPLPGTIAVSNLDDIQISVDPPVGGATEAKQDDQIDLLTTIDADTGNIATSTSSIDTKLSSQATATNQTALNTLTGAVNETAPASDTASSGLNGRLQRISQRLTSLIALLPGSLGQKVRAASLAVTLSSEDITALTPPSPITGFATSALQTTGNSSLSSIDTKLSGPLSVSGSTVGTQSAVVNVGQKAVNTSAVQISASSTVPTNGILIGALSTNSAPIFIGGTGVSTTTGAELLPGASLPFTCNLNTLYIVSAASTTDKVYWNVT